ncbi:hypothetical protein B0A50_05467 [Salinomyces thailandicus]|uniref:trans-L-3-hydroxyproline dehydratase n=1 Tax=Salinomyces thailandicus TaxID=706561 RepID=A0A4U0TVT2_9PEZI|nr:hypothetical protein B0A50_05467 [Salinomyces thailandica]
MYGGFITPPNDDRAQFGVMFWHKDGFSTACGHGTIALGYWAIAQGLVQAPENDSVDIVIDVPSGRVTARAACEGGKVKHMDFVNVTSFQVAESLPATIALDGQKIPVKVDLAFNGAVLACVDVADFRLQVEPRNCQVFIDIQRQIKHQYAEFSYTDRYDIAGVCFFENVSDSDERITQKNVVVLADGLIDRSPCGSGTAARVAVLLAQGRLNTSKTLRHYSILGTVFDAGISSLATSPVDYPACVPWVRGTARLVGKMNFYIDPNDPIYPGFLLR